MTIIDRAIVFGMAESDYFSQPHMNQSSIKTFLRSPAHYRYLLDHPKAPTPAMEFGSAAHCAILEPDQFENRFGHSNGLDRRTKAGKEAHARLMENGKTALTMEQYQAVREISQAVLGHPSASELLSDGNPEASVFGELRGVAAKCRIDWLRNDGILVDLKTTDDAGQDGFKRTVASFRYHLQAAWYLDLATQAGIDAHTFVFIAVEKEPPYAIALYELDDDAIAIGRAIYRDALERYRECVQLDRWPSYDPGVTRLGLPAWAFSYPN